MTLVILQFPNLEQLAKFRLALKETYLEMNVRKLTLNCSCSSEMVHEAITYYGAKVGPVQKEREAY
jgi:hypothetical protein